MESPIDWPNVQRVLAYKVDLWAYDLICLEFLHADGTTTTIDEQSPNFVETMLAMDRALAGIPTNWFNDIMVPAFEPKPTILFEKANQTP